MKVIDKKMGYPIQPEAAPAPTVSMTVEITRGEAALLAEGLVVAIHSGGFNIYNTSHLIELYCLFAETIVPPLG